MHIKISGLSILFPILIVSCCSTIDSRVASGYPFSGNSQELNFTVYRGSDPKQQNNIPQRDFFDRCINDSVTCNQMFRSFDTGYVSDIDFRSQSLVFAGGYVKQVYEVKFQTRVLIDHHAKTCTLEIRAYTKTCSSGLNSSYVNYLIADFLLIPKVPEGYTFQVNRFDPVKH